ncbi:unnamed protein product [Parascedosporium putredinis]|uniref:Protein kinase domain-containing protein n=1 Tax=Parascedosporium putredinis TaxID=1442378 RepID=A0A9P1H4W4_9PEZI|nr:unnamed protein product [Parascedosporium putredinis]CAI7996329.1 unnamed protein product [Parascedosporium putredinis]
MGYPGEWENIHLEGEIEGSSERKVWPTFVFEKSELGDLGQFARSATGRELDTSARLTICQDIGNAIGQLHSHRIIHGDIKPTNVIVFREDDGSFTAKVADFGYSVYFSDADQGIKLAQSHPWYAPECNEYRRMKVQQALKTEVFSFGMLCLWFLFEDCRVGASTASNIEGTATSGDALLASMTSEADFKLGSLMNALYSSDFRVRHYIVQELVKIVQRDPGNPVAGQLTLCHELGFGRARAQSAHLVLSHQDLEGIKAEFQQGMDSQGLLLERRQAACTGHILDAAESIISGEIEGVSPFIGADHLLVVIMKAALSHIKSDLGKLEEALEIQEEVVALCEPYGENDEYYLTVLQDLATLYAENNRLEEAEALSVKVLELTKTALGEEHQDAVVCMINLGALYVDLERTEEAEDLLLGTCAITTRIWHQDHPLTLKARYTLALAYDLQGRYREAIDLMTSVLKGQISTLGGANPDTICTARSLAMIHREQRAYEEAIKIQGYFTKQAGKVLGFTHELTLDVTEDLAETLTQCLHHEEARKLRSTQGKYSVE